MKKPAKTSRGRGVPRSGEAPVLEYVVSRLEWESHTEAKAARAELRALLAVADMARYAFCDQRTCADEFCPKYHSLAADRALSRLARAGKSRGDRP